MLSVKAVVIVLLLSFTLNGAGSCEAKKSGNMQNSNQSGNAGAPVNRQPEQRGGGVVNSDLKTLGRGQHSNVSNAFIAVARDAEVYAALRSMVSNLPDVEQNFFKSNAVVIAFLGQRPTGGYSIRFNRTAEGGLRIEENSPPKGSMSAQVITTPFSVIAVPLNNQESLALDVGGAWRAMIRPYRITSGDFTMTGGIAGRSEPFAVAGSVGVMREGNLATILFDLQSKGGAKERVLRDIASGLVQADGRIKIDRLGAGSFVDMPADALRVTGLFAGNENRISLSFESIPGTIADGYNGRGNLEAEATAPAPQKKKKASMEDVPR